jgi:hypothetical protein
MIFFFDSSLSVERLRQLEPEKYQKMVDYYNSKKADMPKVLFFNKGL